MSITITATANGNLKPPHIEVLDKKGNITGDINSIVRNGDFHISPNLACKRPDGTIAPSCHVTGDGVNESTRWTFDFNGDPNFPFFSPSWPLTSALLTLGLIPVGTDISTDIVRIEGLPDINTPVIQGLPVIQSPVGGQGYVIQLQLLDFLRSGYGSDAILGKVMGDGKIPMLYHDDSIIYSAKLELAQNLPAFKYVVKFVCGNSQGEVVSPGVYCTAINVHNPTKRPANFGKKIAIALPNEKPGPISKVFDASLKPSEAFEIDCEDIRKHAETDAKFLKGFVVIESNMELDVVAVYTAGKEGGQVETMHTERVAPRNLGIRM